MSVYIISSLSSICFSWLTMKNRVICLETQEDAAVSCKRVSYFIFATFSFIPLFFVSALRYGISFDYQYTYVPVYHKIASGDNTHCEIGYVILNKIVQFAFNNVDWIFIITSFIFLILVFHVILNRSINIPFSVFLLIGTRLYFSSFGQIRQYIVIAIFLYSLKYIEQNKFLKFLVVTLIAASFHTLALAYIPVFFICKIKVTRNIYMISAFVLCMAGPLIRILYNLIARTFYSNYFSSHYGTDHISEIMIFLTLFTFFLTIFYYNRIPDTKYNAILIKIQWIAAVLSVTTIGISESYRILALFMYSSILLIPQIIAVVGNRYFRFLLQFTIVIIFSLATFHFLMTNGYMLPYQTIFAR